MSELSRLRFQGIFPILCRYAGDEQVQRWLTDFSDAFPERDWEPLERFRGFPIFMRNERRLGRLKDVFLVDLTSWEWAEFSALYSPGSEERERLSLRPLEKTLNPTLQILRLETDLLSWIASAETMPSPPPPPDKKMFFIYRRSHLKANGGTAFELRWLNADWALAAIVDLLLEGARMGDAALLEEIQAHHGTGHAAAWRERIRALVDAQLILEGA